MLKIEHIAIWCRDLEMMKAFYKEFFKATSNEKYTNKQTGFSSYFISFPNGGPRLELMQMPDLLEIDKPKEAQIYGLAHFCFEVENRADVDEYAELLMTSPCQLLGGPRWTGDGYYEVEALDPENNRIEIMSR